MKAELITPFVDATLNVIQTMAQIRAEPGKPSQKKDDKTRGEVTGLIGMGGDELSGNMILSFEKAAILPIVSAMLMEEFTEINQDVIDAVGELTNMITGGAKKLLAEKGYTFAMATPVMLSGSEVVLTQLSPAPIVSIPFTTPSGTFWIEANLAPVTNSSPS